MATFGTRANGIGWRINDTAMTRGTRVLQLGYTLFRIAVNALDYSLAKACHSEQVAPYTESVLFQQSVGSLQVILSCAEPSLQDELRRTLQARQDQRTALRD